MFSMKLKRTGRRKPIPKLPRGGRVKVGFPAGQVGSDVLNIAVWNHYGTRTIPERPFLDNAMRDNKAKYQRAMRNSAKRILRGETGMRTILSRLGLQAQGDVQEEITALRSPPNAPGTIKQKGSSNPLIHTGRMRQAVTHKVET